jgi:hypothetical protein
MVARNACKITLFTLSASIAYLGYLLKSLTDYEHPLELYGMSNMKQEGNYLPQSLDPEDAVPVLDTDPLSAHNVNLLFIQDGFIIQTTESLTRCNSVQKRSQLGYEFFTHPDVNVPCVNVTAQVSYYGSDKGIRDLYNKIIFTEGNKTQTFSQPASYRSVVLNTYNDRGLCTQFTCLSSVHVTQFNLDAVMKFSSKWQGTAENVFDIFFDMSAKGLIIESKKACYLSADQNEVTRSNKDCVTRTALIALHFGNEFHKLISRTENDDRRVISKNQFVLFANPALTKKPDLPKEHVAQSTNARKLNTA